MSRTRLCAIALALLVSSLGLVACSGGSDDSTSSGDSSAPVKVTITEKDGKITPIGKVVKVAPGQKIDLIVTSDVEDEIHVHSDPEHEYEVKAGAKPETFSFTIDTPGTWEVESHGLEVTLLKLQVS
jgi:hypothetical protein